MASDLRMNAYYFSFEPTGVDAIDRVLSAVATAGKAYHHTEWWGDGMNDDDSMESGNSYEQRIQRAANEAATAARLEAAEQLREAADDIRGARLGWTLDEIADALGQRAEQVEAGDR